MASGIDLTVFRTNFNTGINELLQNRASNSNLFTKTEYEGIIQAIEKAKCKTSKTSAEYRLLNRYQVVQFN